MPRLVVRDQPECNEPDREMEFQAHLEVEIKLADNLGPVWTVDDYGVDWEVGPFEGPFFCSLGCNHGGGDVP